MNLNRSQKIILKTGNFEKSEKITKRKSKDFRKNFYNRKNAIVVKFSADYKL
jgi:hypothetical protein